MTARRNGTSKTASQRNQDTKTVRTHHLQDFRALVVTPSEVNWGLGWLLRITPTGPLFTVRDRAFALSVGVGALIAGLVAAVAATAKPTSLETRNVGNDSATEDRKG
jgi:hypothetical protein